MGLENSGAECGAANIRVKCLPHALLLVTFENLIVTISWKWRPREVK